MITAAQVFLEPGVSDRVVTHEVGHAVLGLHHVDRLPGLADPVMLPVARTSDGAFSALEQEAIRITYSRRLRPGSPRPAFMAQNLIVR